MALPATDAFTAANGTLLTTYSASWTQLQGSNDIIANGCCPNQTGDNIAYWNADAFAGDHYAECAVADLFSSSSGAGMGVAVRVQSGAVTCYGWEANTSFSRLVKLAAGTKTVLDDTLAIPSIGARVRLEVTGTGPVTLSVYYDDVLAGSVEDATDVITGGSAGVIGFGNSGTARIDDWEADNLGGGGGETGDFSAAAEVGATFGAVASARAAITEAIAAGDIDAGIAAVEASLSAAVQTDAQYQALAAAADAIAAGLEAGETWAAIAAAESGLTAGVGLGASFAGVTEGAQTAALEAGTEAAAQFLAAVASFGAMSAGMSADSAFASVAASLATISAGVQLGATFTTTSSTDISIIGAVASVRRVQAMTASVRSLGNTATVAQIGGKKATIH